MNQRDQYEEAIAWCVEYGVVVRFLSGFIHAASCVRIKVGGYPNIERPSFLAAVQAAQAMVAKHEQGPERAKGGER